MSEIKSDGGQAFPCAFPEMGGVMEHGMSLRDWFAGQALAGMLADPSARDTPERLSNCAYELADAMLAARDGGK